MDKNLFSRIGKTYPAPGRNSPEEIVSKIILEELESAPNHSTFPRVIDEINQMSGNTVNMEHSRPAPVEKEFNSIIEMNSLEFFEMIAFEWCKSEEQHRPFWRDVLTFARKYYKERKVREREFASTSDAPPSNP